MLDFHNHLIPGVDDGARSLEESALALRLVVEGGITALITTPHITGSALLADGAAVYRRRVDHAWSELKSLAQSAFPSVTLERGFEVLLDVPRVDFSATDLRLAGSKFVLVEFPLHGIPVNSARTLFEIKMTGVTPIVAHPERYRDLDEDLDLVRAWQDSGALVQINSGSLIGAYGDRARRLAYRSLELGLASYLCSDYHARGRVATPLAKSALERHGGTAVAELLTNTNPFRILQGLDPLPVPQLKFRQSGLAGLVSRLRRK